MNKLTDGVEQTDLFVEYVWQSKYLFNWIYPTNQTDWTVDQRDPLV